MINVYDEQSCARAHTYSGTLWDPEKAKESSIETLALRYYRREVSLPWRESSPNQKLYFDTVRKEK